MGRERSGTEAGVSDAPENANEEFGRGDQQFGGGAGDVQYGEQPDEVGVEGVVAGPDLARLRDRIVADDEQEGVALPGSDPEDLLAQDEGDELERRQAAKGEDLDAPDEAREGPLAGATEDPRSGRHEQSLDADDA